MGAPAKARKSNMGIIVLVLALLLTMVVSFLFLAFFSYAPVLCACCVGILYVIGLYLGFESKAWHHAQEFENRFWTVMAFLFSTALFYSKDSPFAIGRYSTSLGCVLVIAFTLAVQFLDRHIHREQLANQGRITRPQLTKDINTAHTKTSIIAQCVASVDPIYLPSTINLIVNGEQVKGQEQRVLDILMKAEKTELNYILGHIQLALLFYKVKDPCRTHICQLLCETRVMELTVNSRAIVLDALMLMKLTAHAKGELWAKNILLRTTGDDLSILKSTTDSKGTVHTMHQLVYHDIRSDAVRTAVLNHIQRQAKFQLAHMQISTKNIGGKRKQLEWRKVLSDVDDTLESSGGMWPAGVDQSYPRHTVYPGVITFYRELDLGPNNMAASSSTWEDGRLGNLTFISARPHVYKDLSEKKSIKKFDRLHSTRGLHCLPSMLAGSVASGTAFVVKGDLEPMALKKFDNFREYYAIYPEYKHIFIGDNGQGDVRAAQLIADTYGSSVLEAGYFHLVQPLESTHGFTDKDTYKRQNIFFFDTYVGAAVQAYRLHQISKRGLQQVAEEASATFLAMQWKPHDADRREANRVKLNVDFTSANEILQEQSVPLIGKPQRYDVGTVLETPFGKGLIVAYNAVTGIYAVDLVEWWTRSANKQPAKAYLPEASLSRRPLNDFSLAAVTTTLPPSHNPGSYVRASMVSSMDPLLLSQGVLPLRTPVVTPFGPGVVLSYRPDDVYIVQVRHVGTLYCQRHVVSVPPDSAPSSRSSFVRSSIGYIAKKFKFMASPSQGPSSSSSPPPNLLDDLTTLDERTFPEHSRVQTPFGVGVVVSYARDVYRVTLVDPALALVTVSVQTRHVTLLSPPGDSAHHHPFRVHTLVSVAPFGIGRVQRFRPKHSIYQVQFVASSGGSMVGYVHASTVRPVVRPRRLVRQWAVHTKVQSPFGRGIVSAATNDAGVVGVTLSASRLEHFQVFVQADALVEELVPVRGSGLGLLSRLRRTTMWFDSKPPPEKDPVVAGGGAAEAAAPPPNPKLGKPVRTLWGPGVLEAVRPADDVHVVAFKSGMLAFLDAASVGDVVAAAMGDVVKTPFGQGVVLGYRRRVFVVQFSYAVGYIQPRDLERLPDKAPPAACAIM